MTDRGNRNPGAQDATGADQKAGGLQDQINTTGQPRKPTRQREWRNKNPRRYLAHLYVQNALRCGLIHKGPCEVCGAVKADAHHDDYERPLAVRFLCRKHHAQHHQAERAKGEGA